MDLSNRLLSDRADLDYAFREYQRSRQMAGIERQAVNERSGQRPALSLNGAYQDVATRRNSAIALNRAFQKASPEERDEIIHRLKAKTYQAARDQSEEHEKRSERAAGLSAAALAIAGAGIGTLPITAGATLPAVFSASATSAALMIIKRPLHVLLGHHIAKKAMKVFSHEGDQATAAAIQSGDLSAFLDQVDIPKSIVKRVANDIGIEVSSQVFRRAREAAAQSLVERMSATNATPLGDPKPSREMELDLDTGPGCSA